MEELKLYMETYIAVLMAKGAAAQNTREGFISQLEPLFAVQAVVDIMTQTTKDPIKLASYVEMSNIAKRMRDEAKGAIRNVFAEVDTLRAKKKVNRRSVAISKTRKRISK